MSARTSVLASADEAVAAIPDGAVVGIGGAVTAAHPMALVRALARRGVRDLTVVAPTGGLDVDLLIAAGCVSTVVASYVGMEGAAGVAPVFRRAAQEGGVTVRDLDEAHCVAALRAAAQRLPFLPWRGGAGTAFPELNPELVEFQDPVAGETLIAVPALRLDFALIYAETADEFGNAQVEGTGNMDQLLGAAADRVVVQVDRVVGNDQIRRDPARTWFWRQTQVVRAPFGTHPYSNAWMVADGEHLAEYAAAGRAGEAELASYLRRYLEGAADHDAYLEEIGIRRISSLLI
ncbi:MAG TPA: CoA-transferase [Solirubrobacterales bacterium]|nr:CoA-transferase [Solirubrobacterales bacterium]